MPRQDGRSTAASRAKHGQKTPEGRARSLANHKHFATGKARPPRVMAQTPPVNNPLYGNEHGAAGFIRFTEEHLFVDKKGKPFSTIKWDPWQIEGIIRPLFDPPLAERPSTALVMVPKKNGKSTIGAAVAFYRLFRHDYEPDCSPEELYLLASDKEQASWIMFDKVRKACARDYRLAERVRVTKDWIERKDDWGVLRVLPCDASCAGLNPSGVFADELWLYRYERMREVWEELTTVPTRLDPINLVVSYAGQSEDCLLYDMYARGLAKLGLTTQEAEQLGVLYAPEGHDAREVDKKFFFYCSHVNEASWVDAAYLEGQRKNLRRPTYLRLHENRWSAGSEAFCTSAQLDRCFDRAKAHGVARGMPLASEAYVGIDAGTHHDCTAMAMVSPCEVDGQPAVRLLDHAVFVPPGGGAFDLSEIATVVKGWQALHNIAMVRYDQYQMVRVAQELELAGLSLEPYGQTVTNLVRMCATLHEHVTQARLLLYESDEVRQHILNAHTKEHPQGWRLVKQTVKRKIDLAVALAMAVQECADAQAAGVPEVSSMSNSREAVSPFQTHKQAATAWINDRF